MAISGAGKRIEIGRNTGRYIIPRTQPVVLPKSGISLVSMGLSPAEASRFFRPSITVFFFIKSPLRRCRASCGDNPDNLVEPQVVYGMRDRQNAVGVAYRLQALF